jgi:hypothetical protein
MDFNIWNQIDQLLNDLPAQQEFKPKTVREVRKRPATFPARKSSLSIDSFIPDPLSDN